MSAIYPHRYPAHDYYVQPQLPDTQAPSVLLTVPKDEGGFHALRTPTKKDSTLVLADDLGNERIYTRIEQIEVIEQKYSNVVSKFFGELFLKPQTRVARVTWEPNEGPARSSATLPAP